MAIYRKDDYKCENCGYYFTDNAVVFIRIPKDDLKDKVLSHDIFDHKCPKCNYDNYVPTRFEYIDDNKKIAIISATYEAAILDRIDIKKEFPNYQIFISETPFITSDIINAIDNNLDPLTLEFIKYHATKYINHKAKNYQVEDSYILYKDEYEFKMVAIVSDCYGNYDEIEIPISDKMYNDYSNRLERFKGGMDKSIISPTYFDKLYLLERNSQIEESKKKIIKLVACLDKDGNLLLATSNNDYNYGDKVELPYADETVPCTVERVITMTDYEYYDFVARLPFVE